VRVDRLTGRQVLLAPGRRGRPDEYARVRLQAPSSPRHRCPFCPGHEEDTPPTVLALPQGGGPWQVRVFANRWPALPGRHEVLVETPRHEASLARLEPAELALALEAYRERMRVLAKLPGTEHVTAFRNSGAEAGATHVHAHGQLLALPFVPRAAAALDERLARHRAATGRCLVCDEIEAELAAGARLVAADERFVLLAPYASRQPFELRLLPRAHGSRSLREVEDAAILAALASSLLDALRRLERAASDPPYNLAFVEPPLAAAGGHWFLEVVPRLATTGGFEWGAEATINSVPPEDAAAALCRVTG
jgi:UDPglucose--hexose-1-phosphate uridylyltransferase